MTPEVADIFYNSERIGTIDRAKQYVRHVAVLFNEIERLEARVRELEHQCELQDSDPEARRTIDAILDVITESGYHRRFIPVG